MRFWCQEVFLLSLWKKLIWEGVWYLDPMDSVCVFTRSVHGVERAREVRAAWRALLLPQKEPAWAPVDETFSPFFKADIRPSFSLLKSSRSAGRRKRRRKWMSCS